MRMDFSNMNENFVPKTLEEMFFYEDSTQRYKFMKFNCIL